MELDLDEIIKNMDEIANEDGILTNVVLPDPGGPTMATVSPGLISILIAPPYWTNASTW